MSWLRKWFGLGKREDTLLTLKLRLARWRHLLRAEESCLNLLGDIREKLSGEYVLDRQYILSTVGQIFQKSYQVAYDMGVLGDIKRIKMYPWLDGLKEKISTYMTSWPLIMSGPLLFPLAGNEFAKPDQVGEMGATLLEIKKKGLADIPQGFIITIQGFLHLLKANNLDGHLRSFSRGRKTDWREGYQSLAQGLLKATIPGELRAAIQEAIQSLKAKEEQGPALILCPSPLRSEILPGFPWPTWAWSGGSLDSFLDLLRSLWSEVSLSGAKQTEAYGQYPPLSAVICQSQISGGDFLGVQTLDPAHPDGEEILLYRLPGAVSSDSFKRIKSQEFRFSRNRDRRGLDPPTVGSQEGNFPKDQRLTELSLRVENYFKRAQEILWQEDGEGKLFLRQIRFLDVLLEARSAAAEKITLLLKGRPKYYSQQGKIISRGIASGSTVHWKLGEDPALFPEDGILVARQWCPDWRPLIPKTAAVLIEQIASPSLAFLARAHRIPAISQLPGLMEKIPDHTIITVDAEDNFVYENRIAPLLDAQLLEGHRLEDEPEYLLLDGALRAIDPSYPTGEAGTSPRELEGCRTLLEGIQWARRQAMDILFDTEARQHFIQDQWALPVTGENQFPLYAIDLEETLAGSNRPSGSRTSIKRTDLAATSWFPLWQSLYFSLFSRTLSGGEENPFFLIFTENTFFLCQSSAKGRVMVDGVVTGAPELNHLFFYVQESGGGMEAGPVRSERILAPGCEKNSSLYEIRAFGKSAGEMKEVLKQTGLRLDP